jgi:hypothetical protein
MCVTIKQNRTSSHCIQNALKTSYFSRTILESHSYAGGACRNAFGHSRRMSVLFAEFNENFKGLIVLINSMLSIFMKIHSVVHGQLHGYGQWTNRTI